VGRLLACLQITPQKPLRRAYERDPEAVQEVGKEHLSEAAQTSQTPGRVYLFPRRGRIQFRAQPWKNLRHERTNPCGRHQWATPEGQRHQHAQQQGSILEQGLHQHAQRRAVCGAPQGFPRGGGFFWWWTATPATTPKSSKTMSGKPGVCWSFISCLRMRQISIPTNLSGNTPRPTASRKTAQEKRIAQSSGDRGSGRYQIKTKARPLVLSRPKCSLC